MSSLQTLDKELGAFILPLGEGPGDRPRTSALIPNPSPKVRREQDNPEPAAYFFINSSTAVVIALIPVRRVGSGSG
jgi:hypothetical protein